jgi:hypothetical protein
MRPQQGRSFRESSPPSVRIFYSLPKSCKVVKNLRVFAKSVRSHNQSFRVDFFHAATALEQAASKCGLEMLTTSHISCRVWRMIGLRSSGDRQ